MAHYYEPDEMYKILRDLSIQPVNGTINTKEVAALWNWRAKNEMNKDAHYTDTTVRRRVSLRSFEPVGGYNPKSRYNTFTVESAFIAQLFPTRSKNKGVDNVTTR